MKSAALAVALLLHMAAVGAFWLMAGAGLPTSSRPLDVVVLAAPVSATAALPVADTSGESVARSPARIRIAAEPAHFAAINTKTGSAIPIAAPETGGSADAGAIAASGVAVVSASGARTPVTLPADHAASNRKPDYPVLSRRNDEQGTVVLRVLVSASGHADKVQIRQSSGHPLLDESALNAVRVWRFRPATSNSQPIAEWYQLAIPFKLNP